VSDEYAAQRARLKDLSEALPGLLPGTWTPRHDRMSDWPPVLKLARGDGAVLAVGATLHPSTRWQVYGWPPETGVQTDRTQFLRGISCAQSRTVEEVAREIVRRFLPAFDTVAAETLARRDERVAREAAIAAVAERLGTVPGIDYKAVRPENRTRRDEIHLSWRPVTSFQGPSADATVSASTAVQGGAPLVDIACHHLDPARAEAVLRALTEAPVIEFREME
jgi:hypothetical protein